MTVKHTNGPWHVGMRPGPIVYGPLGEHVADLRAELIPDDETKGNIRLITAAPALLEALELAEATIMRLARTDSANGTLDVVRAAIAQAQGE